MTATSQQPTAQRRLCQRDRLILLLKSRSPHYVPLSEILVAAGAQYGARIHEARALGHRIESKPGGSAFRLVTYPAIAVTTSNVEPRPRPVITARAPAQADHYEGSLFGNLAADRTYRE